MKSTLPPSQGSKIQITSFGGKCHVNSRAQIFKLGRILEPPTEFFQVPMPGPQHLTLQFHWSGGSQGREALQSSRTQPRLRTIAPRCCGERFPLGGSFPKLTYIFFNEDENFYNKRLLWVKSRKYMRVHKVVYPRFLINAEGSH